MTFVLASRSPQRRAILTQLGLAFRIAEPVYVEEPLPLPPHELAEQHSLGKARSVEARAEEIVLGVDTIVLIDGFNEQEYERAAARIRRLLAEPGGYIGAALAYARLGKQPSNPGGRTLVFLLVEPCLLYTSPSPRDS